MILMFATVSNVIFFADNVQIFREVFLVEESQHDEEVSKIPALLIKLPEDLDIQVTSNRSPELITLLKLQILGIVFSFSLFVGFIFFQMYVPGSYGNLTGFIFATVSCILLVCF